MPSPLYLCLHIRDFAAQALTGAHGGANHGGANHGGANNALHSVAVAVLSGDPPLERIFAINRQARILGLELSMSRVQAESFPAVLLRRDRQQEERSFAELIRCAERFSPRIEIIASPQEESCGATLVLDVSGSQRLLGNPRQIANALQQSIRGIGYEGCNEGYDEASVAAAQNAYAAVLAARGIQGVTAIAPGREAEPLAPLPLHVLELDEATAQTFATWGIQTLGQLAALPTKSLVARVGQRGWVLQAQARGEYSHLLVPTAEPADAPLCEAIELEHPVELLAPLLFLLSHMLDQITERAAQRTLAIASVETCLVLEANAPDANAGAPFKPAVGEHRRTICPALPERDHHTLLKLIQLDLESHPPGAAVVALRMKAYPAPPQTAQQGLFAAQAPEAGRMEILLARLRKLVGEERVGAPELLDSHAPEPFRVATFEPASATQPNNRSGAPHLPSLADVGSPNAPALRMVRPPRAVAVELRINAPNAILPHAASPNAMDFEGRRLTIQSASGPWRTSGAWWTHPAWCREEWDVVLNDEPPRCLRLARDPSGELAGGPFKPSFGLSGIAANAGCWYVIGIYD